MASTKDEILEMIRTLPNDVTVEDVMAELHFTMQVDAGLKELDEGKAIPHEEAKKRLAKGLDQ